MIRYTEALHEVSATMLRGFFDGWPNPPSPESHLRILQGSDAVVLALDDEAGRAAGFVTAISDGVLCACIPLLEVLPQYRGRGIGKELMKRMLDKLGDFYAVDLICDPELQPFYEACGMKRATGMMVRNYERQSANAG